MRLVERPDRVDAHPQRLQLAIALADALQTPAEIGNGLVVRVEQAALGQQRVHERTAQRAFDEPPELRARRQRRVHVEAVGVEGDGPARHLLVVDGHEHQVDIRFFPHGVVRQAAAQDGGQDGAVLADLGDERVEGAAELVGNRGVGHVPQNSYKLQVDKFKVELTGRNVLVCEGTMLGCSNRFRARDAPLCGCS